MIENIGDQALVPLVARTEFCVKATLKFGSETNRLPG
jgi:hypothetical protein